MGTEVPAFTLQTPDGKTVSFERRSGEAQLARDGKSETPKLFAIHLLQPDCLQCRAQLKALEEVHKQFAEKGLVVLGISHREDSKALAAMGAELKITFPLLVGGGSDLAKQFAAGDTFSLVDHTGVVRFAQVGYGTGDEKVWIENIQAMLDGKPVIRENIERERLKIGDSFPAIVLPSLRTGKPMTLVGGKGGRLVFRGEDDKETRPLGTIFFFSRYWAFSREEIVHLQKFHERYAKDGLQVLVISMHPEPHTARKMTADLKATFPIFEGYKSELGKQYAFGWPAFILDAVGVIKYTQVGFEQGDEKKYEKVIQQILGRL